MSTPTIDLEVRNYMAAVKAELEDLEPTERDDLLEDLEAHLREVAAEGGGSLEERLGSPAAYAAELRASAGLPEYGRRTKPSMRARIDRSATMHLFRSIAALPAMRPVLDFLAQLKPGWWLLRAYLLVEGADIVVGHYHNFRELPLPSIWGSWLAGVPALLIFAVVSVVVGYSARRNRLMRLMSIIISIVAVLFAWVAGNEARSFISIPQEASRPAPDFVNANGNDITNVCPYTTDLKPLAGVLLFDQDGVPIDIGTFGPDRVQGLTNLYPRSHMTWAIPGSPSRLFTCPTLQRRLRPAPSPAVTLVP